MKKIIVTYDTGVFEEGKLIAGETAATLDVGKDVAIILGSGYYDAVRPTIEKALRALEELKQRKYVEGSVKTIEVIS